MVRTWSGEQLDRFFTSDDMCINRQNILLIAGYQSSPAEGDSVVAIVCDFGEEWVLYVIPVQ